MVEFLSRLHHVTACTGTAQGDIDFFAKVLGQKLVKQTMVYDGTRPFYHLYFGNESGDPGTLMTTFCLRQTNLKARRGVGQFSALAYSIPEGSLPFWQEHFARNNIACGTPRERFGQRYVTVSHPDCGVVVELIEDGGDTRKPFASPHVPLDHAIRGFHNWSITIRDMEDMHGFLTDGWHMTRTGTDDGYVRYQFGSGGAARYVDAIEDHVGRPGDWKYGEGVVHHAAFETPDIKTQSQIKADLEGLGYTDCSERKHRGYFESVYVRSPGGPLFEATHTLGFTIDEDEEQLGKTLQIAPQFKDRLEDLVAGMNDPFVPA